MTNKLSKLLKGFLVVFSETGILEELFKIVAIYIYFLLSKGSVLYVHTIEFTLGAPNAMICT